MCLQNHRVTLAEASTCGTTRRSSPGRVQVSSSAAPQTQARMLLDFIVSNCRFVCVSISEMQTFTVSESFQRIPSLGSERQVSSDLSRICPRSPAQLLSPHSGRQLTGDRFLSHIKGRAASERTERLVTPPPRNTDSS